MIRYFNGYFIVMVLVATVTVAVWAVCCPPSRQGYCAVACADARACGIRLPDRAEERCAEGTHRIKLPDPLSCPALEAAISKAGRLW